MIIFKYGFEHKGFKYGWSNKQLYRLPISLNQRCYAFKKLNLIKIGNKVGYRLKKDKITIEQLRDKTISIDYIYNSVSNSDCPF